jgi:hypothetical protein
MNASGIALLGELVLELIKIITEACKKTPAKTGAELKADVQADLAARAANPDWLTKAAAAGDTEFNGTGKKE